MMAIEAVATRSVGSLSHRERERTEFAAMLPTHASVACSGITARRRPRVCAVVAKSHSDHRSLRPESVRRWRRAHRGQRSWPAAWASIRPPPDGARIHRWQTVCGGSGNFDHRRERRAGLCTCLRIHRPVCPGRNGNADRQETLAGGGRHSRNAERAGHCPYPHVAIAYEDDETFRALPRQRVGQVETSALVARFAAVEKGSNPEVVGSIVTPLHRVPRWRP
jgi:hypothetical protein